MFKQVAIPQAVYEEAVAQGQGEPGSQEVAGFLARLGGWVERKDNRPGKVVLTRGLRRLIDMRTTQAFVDRYRQEHGALPPKIAAWFGEPSSRD